MNISCRLLTPYYFPFHLFSCVRDLSYAVSLTLPMIDILVRLRVEVIWMTGRLSTQRS
jgi:hypothetical protein